MTDQIQERPLVDLDAGEGFGFETIELMRPFKYKGVEYRSVTLRWVSAGDIERVNDIKDEKARIDAQTQLMLGLSEDVIAQFYTRDAREVRERVGEQFARHPTYGA